MMIRMQPYRSPRFKGSALILVAVSLVLMAMLGVTFVQTARVERQITSIHTRGGNIDSNIQTVVQQIQTVLRNDLLDDSGRFFNPFAPTNATDPNDPDAGGADEPYDYPWTNTNSDWVVTLLDGTVANGQPGQPDPAKGGQFDDTWLASTTPDFSQLHPKWPHITNLNGIFLLLPSPKASDSVTHPKEYPVTNTPQDDVSDTEWPYRADTNLKITAKNDPDPDDPTNNYEGMDYGYVSYPDTQSWLPSGADADGDGIFDSRWTWAPIRKIGDVMYVMAVRIIDNSSLVNVNAATALTSDGSTFESDPTKTDLWIRGYSPTDVDLSRLLLSPKPASWPPLLDLTWPETINNELNDLMKNSLGFTAPPDPDDPTNPDPDLLLPMAIDLFDAQAATGRWDAWLNNVRLYGDRRNKLTIEDEFELRYRGGLNHEITKYRIDDNLDYLLRDDSDQENSFADIPTLMGATTPQEKVDQKREFFHGGSGLVSARQFPAIRHMLTTVSGHAVLAANHDDIHSGNHELKYDLIYQDTATPATRAANIADRLKKIFKITDASPASTNAYLGLDLSDPDDSATIDRLATEFALAIQDYADEDSIPTGLPIGAVTYYGLETLPFIREVYVQFAYKDVDKIPLPFPNNDGIYDTWERVAGSQAIAIEIANPFDRPIQFDKVEIRLRMVELDITPPLDDPPMEKSTFELDPGASPNPFSGFALIEGLPVLSARTSPGASAIIYSNPDPSKAVDEDGNGQNLATDLGFNSDQKIKAPDGSIWCPIPLDGNKVAAELQVKVNGTWVTYDRFDLSELSEEIGSSASISHIPSPTNPLVAEHCHIQVSVARAGQHPRYISNNGKKEIGKRNEPPVGENPDKPKYQVGVDNLTSDSKAGITGNTALDVFQLPIANRPFYSTAELGWIHMLGFTDEPNGDFPQRFDDIAAIPANQRFLNFSDSAVVPSSTGIPHAAMVMDQFTTLSPRYDGVDNDNNDRDNLPNTSVDNVEEQFVPGTININTVPLHLATLAAPLPEGIDDVQALMDQIVDYRDNPKTDPVNDTTATNRITGITGLTDPSSTNLRHQPGIASIGELMFVNPGADPTVASNIQMYGNDTVDQSAINDPHNLYPLPENVYATPPKAFPQSAMDGPEESMARFQFLSQVFTTRSDIFTAYVVLKGFPADDFTKGAVESVRFMAVFDRSGITGPDDPVRVLGVYKVK